MTEKNLGLYVNDQQLYELLGVGKDKGRAVIDALLPLGFPPKDPIFKLHYFPAVRAFLDERHGLNGKPPTLTPDGKENWDD
jgi:hypothetical protein